MSGFGGLLFLGSVHRIQLVGEDVRVALLLTPEVARSCGATFTRKRERCTIEAMPERCALTECAPDARPTMAGRRLVCLRAKVALRPPARTLRLPDYSPRRFAPSLARGAHDTMYPDSTPVCDMFRRCPQCHTSIGWFRNRIHARFSGRPDSKWYRYSVVRRFCPHCSVELRWVARPRRHFIFVLMAVAINSYFLFLVSYPSKVRHAGPWVLAVVPLLIVLPMVAAYQKWGFGYSVVAKESTPDDAVSWAFSRRVPSTLRRNRAAPDAPSTFSRAKSSERMPNGATPTFRLQSVRGGQSRDVRIQIPAYQQRDAC